MLHIEPPATAVVVTAVMAIMHSCMAKGELAPILQFYHKAGQELASSLR